MTFFLYVIESSTSLVIFNTKYFDASPSYVFCKKILDFQKYYGFKMTTTSEIITNFEAEQKNVVFSALSEYLRKIVNLNQVYLNVLYI